MLAGLAHAETYRWVDDKGVVHFTDNPDRIPARYLKRVQELPSVTVPSPSPSATPDQQAPRPVPAPGGEPPVRQPEGAKQYGGKDETAWRAQFATVRNELKALQEGLPKKREQLAQLRRKRVIYQGAQERVAYNEMKARIDKDEARLVELEKELAALGLDADKAGVPGEWRR